MGLKAVTFDVGGTLDAPGIPWRPRFEPLYREAGVLHAGNADAFARAFYDADDHLHERHALAGLDFAQTVRFQVGDTLANLGVRDAAVADRIADAFTKESRASFTACIPVLRALAQRVRLGVVSNFYGNLEDVLRHEGLLGYFHVVIDSGKLGVTKPTPRIFHAACDALGVTPGQVVHVGDSYPRDVEGALGAGLAAIWLAPGETAARDPRVIRIDRLEEVTTALERAVAS